MMKKICVVGLGYIGLPTCAMFAKAGFQVTGVDVNPLIIDTVNEGKIHIEEVGLGELVKEEVSKGNLNASLKPVLADVYIIAVPTPHNYDHTADLKYVQSAVESIKPFLQKGNILIVESTIPPRTINDIVAPAIEEAGWKVGEEIYLAHCPERVLPGRILIELVENARIVGGINEISANKAADIYKSFVKGNVITTTAVTAEMAKLMENTFRDVNIALANELAKISANLGINALDVISLANLHPRVNLHTPGPGVGGHCLAVDPYFIIEKDPQNAQLISDAREINNSMPSFVVENVGKILGEGRGKITVMGLTYKGNIDDVRESPAMEIVELLGKEGYEVAVYDPHVVQEAVPYELKTFKEAVDKTQCILVLSDHNEFKNLDEEAIIKGAERPIIFDTRNCVQINNKAILYYNYNNLHEAINNLVCKNI
ncbi:nucleotide sugar dehydrogenase [Bacillus mycoides]|uniref:nucleotide sugar dehydrogenase n=1 Tax=Bacillus mycoides TaxID=1405 RepID=UPI0005342DE7|nr:nucleotide sugar dehydrogenase [Bacillus mycoides]